MEMEEMGTVSDMAVRVTAIGTSAKISKVVMGGDAVSIRITTNVFEAPRRGAAPDPLHNA